MSSAWRSRGNILARELVPAGSAFTPVIYKEVDAVSALTAPMEADPYRTAPFLIRSTDLHREARVEARVQCKIVIAPRIAEHARFPNDVVAARMRVTMAPKFGARALDQFIEVGGVRRAQPVVPEALRH